jgi:perosamine synthetase
MNVDADSMIVAKDQFWSWTMISPRRRNLSDALESTRAVRRYSLFQARNALYHSLNLLGIERGAHILVPAYICRAAVDPLLAYGLKVDFYGLTRDCQPIREDLERAITPRTQAIMVVHYFGFPQSIGYFRELCYRNNLSLIEDCAHVLCGDTEGEAIGSVGDAAVFSWRKFLPIYDGAELVLNRPPKRDPIALSRESGFFTLRVAANMLDSSLRQTRKPLLKIAFRAMQAGEAVFRRAAKSHLEKIPMMQAETSTIDFELQNVDWPMSRLSRWVKRHANVESIVSRRRRNYETLLRELADSAAQPVFSSLPATGCPWVFPVIFPNFSEAHLLLRRRGIPAVTWGWVRHPHIPRGRFADSDFLYDNLVFLPIHQCLTDEDIFKVSRVVREACAR